MEPDRQEILHEPLAKIRFYTHFFTVEPKNSRVTGVVYQFLQGYVEKIWKEEAGRRPYLVGGKVYAGHVQDNSEFRMHMGQWQGFVQALEFANIGEHLLEFEAAPQYTPKPVSFKLIDKDLRDFQIPACQFALETSEKDFNSCLIGAPMGSGKTVMLCKVAELISQQLVICVLPTFMPKWHGDLKENLGLKDKDIWMVKGGKFVKGLIHAGREDPKTVPKAIIISLTTLQDFYDDYEKSPDYCREAYGCAPHEMWEILKVGLIGMDEAHMHLYSVFRFLVNVHGPKVLALSGTMLSEDAFTDKIQRTIFPHTARYSAIKMERYIEAYAMAYEFADYRAAKIRTQAFGRTTYSHVEFEKSIIKNKWVLPRYMEMIRYVIDIGYVYDYKPGDKVRIYAATIDLCTRLVEYLKSCYPDKDVRRYVEQDPYENIIDADIAVTTVISAGTALDMPNLRTVISTIAIKSHKSNLQLLGRLRKLKDRNVKMYWLYCEQVPKHKAYSDERVELFQDRTASIKHLKLPHRV